MTFENDNSLIELEQIKRHEQENLAALDRISGERGKEWTEWANLTTIREKSLEILGEIDRIYKDAV